MHARKDSLNAIYIERARDTLGKGGRRRGGGGRGGHSGMHYSPGSKGCICHYASLAIIVMVTMCFLAAAWM
jgi:hypothetical protein